MVFYFIKNGFQVSNIKSLSYSELMEYRKWTMLPNNQKCVFYTILNYAVTEMKLLEFYNLKFYIRPGQLCVSTRELVDLFGSKMTLYMVRRALINFQKNGWIDVDILKSTGNQIKVL